MIPMLMDRFSAIIKKSWQIFKIEIDKLILSCVGKCKGPKITKTILKNKLRKLTLSDFKTYYKDITIKIV